MQIGISGLWGNNQLWGSRDQRSRSYETEEGSGARCIKERSSGLRHSCGAQLNATPVPTGALQVFLEHK